ncbi:MAG: glutathione S-transferase family protein [Acidihalobacter sp.]|uniref:glutathione S-transferase family protein n=1 Tax=Acidihalobacter sp. TaxID=1872108 RepID=UPI00307F4800
MYKLYSNRYSGHSYKVAMLLELSAAPYRLVEVDLSVPGPERSADFRAVSPFLEVPVLVDGDVHLCQSNNILQYLASRLAPFSETSADEVLRIGEWLFWESNRIGFSIANLRLYRRFIKDFPPDLEHFIYSRAVDDLTVLDKVLSSSAFLVGNRLTIADLSCSGYLFWLHEAGLNVEQWPNVQAWLGRIAAQPRWKSPEELFAPVP